MRVHFAMPGDGPVALPAICIDNQRVEPVDNFEYLGQIIASDGEVKGKVSRKLALGYAQQAWQARNLERHFT